MNRTAESTRICSLLKIKSQGRTTNKKETTEPQWIKIFLHRLKNLLTTFLSRYQCLHRSVKCVETETRKTVERKSSREKKFAAKTMAMGI